MRTQPPSISGGAHEPGTATLGARIKQESQESGESQVSHICPKQRSWSGGSKRRREQQEETGRQEEGEQEEEGKEEHPRPWWVLAPPHSPSSGKRWQERGKASSRNPHKAATGISDQKGEKDRKDMWQVTTC